MRAWSNYAKGVITPQQLLDLNEIYPELKPQHQRLRITFECFFPLLRIGVEP